MGPPEALDEEEPDGNWLENGEVGDRVCCEWEGGMVSQARVRRQDCRMMEKEVGDAGSCCEV